MLAEQAQPHTHMNSVSRAGAVPYSYEQRALQIENSEESDQGKYECVAMNSAGTRYSAPANLYVRGKTLPSVSPSPRHVWDEFPSSSLATASPRFTIPPPPPGHRCEFGVIVSLAAKEDDTAWFCYLLFNTGKFPIPPPLQSLSDPCPIYPPVI
ncbi:hypothetical protein JZ751_009380 [Albula glossodonta]|uniref:Immunoglobulin I-set domain-containing protein n=1 Tax=Albula glossodonta TaxID=121402 RepID=A0A8T2NBQ3_9TELE|nr:hypothetical protein JZ751_009380 [Albula glossodonta]